MNIKCGIINETFKFYKGVFSESNVSRYKTFPEKLWDKYPEKDPVIGGVDLFELKSISLVAGKNDFAAFQVGVFADENYVFSITRDLALGAKKGYKTIRVEVDSDLEAACNIEDMVRDDDRNLKCDVLLRQNSKEYEAYETAMLWVEMKTDASTKAGVHKGKVRIFTSYLFGEEKLAGELDFEVEVIDYVMKSSGQTSLNLDLWQHNSILSRMSEVSLYGDDHFDVMENYVKSLAAIGQKFVTIFASDLPWSGQFFYRSTVETNNMYEYNMARVTRKADGSFVYDFSVMERYIKLCEKYGIDRYIEVFGLINVWVDPEYGFGYIAEDHPDALKIRYWDEKDGRMRFMDKGEYIDAYIRALQDFFEEKGYLDKVVLIADEPLDHDYYKAIVDRVKSVAPKFKFTAAINNVEHVAQSADDFDVFTVYISGVGEQYDAIQKYRKQGKIVNWYVCCVPWYPNNFLRSHLLETRLIGYMTEFLNLDGFLRWDYTFWNSSVRNSLSVGRFPAGDGNFVYPCWDGKPLLSLRYKQIMRAVQDFELLQDLKKKEGAQEFLEGLWPRLFKITDKKELLKCNRSAQDDYVLDYEVFKQVKKEILEKLRGLR